MTTEETERFGACGDGAEKTVLDAYAAELGRSFIDRADLHNQLFLTRFNAAHGTNYPTYREAVAAAATGEWNALQQAIRSETQPRFDEAWFRHNCLLVARAWEYVGDPDSRDIEVHIGRIVSNPADLPPPGWTSPANRPSN
jgi:hypothetical protein